MQLRRMFCSWNAKDYKYKIIKSSTPKDEVIELDEYVFLIRKRLDELLTFPKRLLSLTWWLKTKRQLNRPYSSTLIRNICGKFSRQFLRTSKELIWGKTSSLYGKLAATIYGNSLTEPRSSRICYSTSSMNYEHVIAQETLRTMNRHLLAGLTLAC